MKIGIILKNNYINIGGFIVYHESNYQIGDKVELTHERIDDVDVIEIIGLYVEPEIEIEEGGSL